MLVERVGPVTLTYVAGSPNYYARYRRNGRQVTRSLGTTSLPAARRAAEDIAERLGLRSAPVVNDHSFRRYAEKMLENDALRVKRGERSPCIVTENRRILNTCCSDLAEVDVRRITYQVLADFVAELTDRDLASATIKRILSMVSKALKTAVQAGTIPAMPLFPEVSLKQGVRGWFSDRDYKGLLQACRKHERLKTKVRSQIIGPELRWYITFMVHTFMRPSDSKLLQHRHVEIVRTATTRFLRISTDFSKTVATPIISMPLAVEIYERLLKTQRAAGYGKPDDFLFLPQYPNRKFALEMLRRQFGEVCKAEGLASAPSGEPRTLYSLRHTAIMFRLTKGDRIDLLTLARNARTSVEMIDRFYARHLTAEMNVEQLHSVERLRGRGDG